jgi:protoporphyrinogen oxidase
VGGGISGLYLAWRILTDASNAYDVTVYEVEPRFGGRILSQQIPSIPFRLN